MTADYNVQRLKTVINNVLSAQEQVEFARIIDSYFSTDSISDLAESLDRLLDTPVKRQLVGKLRKLIPRSHVSTFDQVLKGKTSRKKAHRSRGNTELVGELLNSLSHAGKGGRSDKNSTRKARSLPSTGLNGARGFLLSDLPNWEAGLINPVRRILIERSRLDSGRELGLSIRGGAEHGLGIYVSSVVEDSLADRHGLMAGDQINAVNGLSFMDVTNSEAVKILSSSRRLDVEVCHVGRIPGSYETHQSYVWADGSGRTASPPPEVDLYSRYEANEERKSGLMLLKDVDERKVNLSIDGSRDLGIMIRGGKEFGLGVYISGVDSGSAASYSGLKIGDQILDVNGTSFLDISHVDAVAILRSSKRLMLTVKDVGKIPYAMTTYDHTEWIRGEHLPQYGSLRSSKSYSTRSQIMDRYGDSENSLFRRGLGSQLMLSSVSGKASQMALLERKAENILMEKELSKLHQLLLQYQNSTIGVHELLVGLYQVFNTKAKLSLMAQIRNLVAPKDLEDFDSMAGQFNRERHSEENHLMGTHDSWTEQSSTFNSDSTGTLQNNSDSKVSVEMEPLRKAIKEIYEFDGNNFLRRETSKQNDDYLTPNQCKHQQQQQQSIDKRSYQNQLQFKNSKASQTTGDGHSLTETRKYMNQVDKAVATDDENSQIEDGDLQPWSFKPNEIIKTELRNSESNYSNDFGAFGILPYYAQVHLRTIRPTLFTDNEGTLQTDFHSSQLSDFSRGKDSRQKSGGRPANGIRNIQHTLDTVYELHNFSKEVNSNNDIQSDTELNDELVSGAAYANMSGVVQSLYSASEVANPVAQIQYQAYEESQSTGSISFQPDNKLQDEMISQSTVNRKIANRKEKSLKSNPEDLRQPSAYTYFHDDDTLSDMAEAVSQLTDTASVQTSSMVRNSGRQMDNGTALYSAPRSERQVFEIFEKSSAEEENFNFAARNGTKENADDSSKFSRNFLPSVTSRILDQKRLRSTETPSGELQIIKIYKTKSTLGIAIEGGANTLQPTLRIAKIQDTGSAYGSDLQVGQALVAVDGRSLYGLDHEKCIALIARSFKSKKKAYVELVVLDSNQHLVV